MTRHDQRILEVCFHRICNSASAKAKSVWRIRHALENMELLYPGRSFVRSVSRHFCRDCCPNLQASVMDYIAMNLPKNLSHMTHVWFLGKITQIKSSQEVHWHVKETCQNVAPFKVSYNRCLRQACDSFWLHSFKIN